MSICRFCKFLCLVTILAVGYVHLQMTIIDMAYKGRSKQEAIRSLREKNDYLTYHILSLKSSNNLGEKLLFNDKDLQFTDPKDVVELSMSSDLLAEALLSPSIVEEKSNSFLSFLGLGAQAEARNR